MLTPIKLGLFATASVAAAVPASVVLVETLDPSASARVEAPAVIQRTLPKSQSKLEPMPFPPSGATAAGPAAVEAAPPAVSAEEIASRVSAGFETIASPAAPVAGPPPVLPPAPVALGKPAPDLPPGVPREPPVPAAAEPLEVAALAPAAPVEEAEPAAAAPVAVPAPKPAREAKAGEAKVVEGNAKSYRALIVKEAEAQKVPPKLALAVFQIESGFDPKRKGPDGRVGLTQVSYRIAKALGYKGGEQALLDPETNVKWGMKYLAGAYKRADGDTCRATMKFQGGHYVEKQTALHVAYCSKVKQVMASAN